MLIDNILYYEKGLLIERNASESSPIYYSFDYDERSFDINMQFQHFHPFYEMHILLDDVANHIIEGKLYSIRKYDISCLRPNLLHKSEYPKGPPKKRLIIQFLFPYDKAPLKLDYEQILSIFHRQIPIYRFQRSYQEKIFGMINEIYRISKNVTPIHTLLLHNKFIEFLSCLYLYQNQNQYIPDTLNVSHNKIYSITSYIHENYNDDLSLKHLSEVFYMSSYYLSHLFKEITGFTLTNYVQMIRIRNAQQMLLSTNKRIADIGGECGFTSFSQFNRVFNKFCKTSPREFKRTAGMVGATEQALPIMLRYD